MPIIISDLPSTILQSRNHEVPAMKDNITVKLTVAQILGLIAKGDFISKFAAADISFTPVGGISATDIQAALAELDTEKLVKDGGTLLNPAGLLLSGNIYGLSFSNDTGGDVTNDFITSPGTCASDDAVPVLMTLPAAMTKRTDGPWVAGTGQGGWLDGASMPNGTGHVFLMRNPTTGVVDVGVSASPTSPPLPTGFTQKRRIHSAVLRESAALVLVTQNGNDFSRALVQDLSVSSATTNTLITLSVPNGIVVQPKMEWRCILNQSTTVTIQLGNGFDTTSNVRIQSLRSITGQVGDDGVVIPSGFFTNTSRQLNHSRGVTAGSINLLTMVTMGWIDARGRN